MDWNLPKNKKNIKPSWSQSRSAQSSRGLTKLPEEAHADYLLLLPFVHRSSLFLTLYSFSLSSLLYVSVCLLHVVPQATHISVGVIACCLPASSSSLQFLSFGYVGLGCALRYAHPPLSRYSKLLSSSSSSSSLVALAHERIKNRPLLLSGKNQTRNKKKKKKKKKRNVNAFFHLIEGNLSRRRCARHTPKSRGFYYIGQQAKKTTGRPVGNAASNWIGFHAIRRRPTRRMNKKKSKAKKKTCGTETHHLRRLR